MRGTMGLAISRDASILEGKRMAMSHLSPPWAWVSTTSTHWRVDMYSSPRLPSPYVGQLYSTSEYINNYTNLVSIIMSD